MKNLFVLMMLISGNLSAQVACLQDEKPHYFVVVATTKTTMSDALKAALTPQEQIAWVNTYRNFSVVSPTHNDLSACNEALDLLKAQRALAPRNGIHALQSVSYDGYCLAVEVCQ